MKSIRRFIACTVSVLLLLAGLTSCGNLLLKDISEDAIISSQTTQAPQNGTGSLSGTIAFDGAIPAQMLTPSSGARTAFPSTPLTTDNFTFFVKAEGPNVSTVTHYFSGNNFSLSGLVPGVGYTLTVWIFKGTNNTNSDDLLFSGSYAPVTLIEGNPGLTLENPIIVRPVDLPEGQTQTVTFDITSKSKSVSSFSIWIDGGEGDDYQYLNKSFTYAEGASSSTHNAELSLPTGAHALTFQFYQTVNDDQILVYSCKEVINVIKGFDTYTWVKNGNAKHLKNDNTGTSFVIDDACLSQFARSTIYVDPTSSSEEERGTRYSPFKTISKAFAYAQASSSSETNIFIKDGSSEEINGSTELLGKKWNIQTYKNTPGDRQGNATLTFTDDQAIVFCLFNESELSATGITFKGKTGYQSGSDGGFVYIDSGCEGTFNTCSFTYGNSCGYGGAIANFGECTLNGCTFSNNQAETAGGAIFSTGTLTISGTTTIENNISDGNKYDFLSFYGNLTLAGTLNFKDSERFEFHKGNDYYSASSVTLVEGLSVTGSAISKIPLYYDSESNGGTSILNQCFFASGSGLKAAQYFTVPDDGYSTFDIDADGIITTDKLFVNSASSNTTENGLYATPYKTISAALTAANSLSSSEISVFIKDGTEEDCGWTSTISLTNDMSIKVYRETPDTADSNPGTATLYCMGLDDIIYVCADVSISGLIFDGRKASNFLNCCIDLEETHSLTLTDCSFINIKPAGNCGSLAIRSNATFKNCTFHNNDINITGQAFGVTKAGMVTFEGSISIADGEYISLFGDQNDASAFGKIHLESNFSAPDSPYTLTFSNISDGSQIITGKQFDDYNQIFTVPEGYSINSEGEYKKQVFPKTITAGERYTIEPTSNTTADDINKFLSTGTFEFTVDLDLSEMTPDEIKKINVSLPHVETLVLPAGTSFDDNQFGSDSENKGSTLKKVIINGDVTGSWMFQSCNTIEEVVFEEGVTEIPDGMFSKCTSLKTVSLPSTLKTIGYHAFADSAIEEITIPASVTTIKHFAFYSTGETSSSDYKLQSVSFEDTSHTWAIKQGGTGSPLYFEATDQDNISVSNPSSNATYFRQIWGCSEGYWWVKNE